MNLKQLVLIEQNQTKFISNLFQPIKNYVRIKYTFYAINSKYLICGASSGGLYLFNRQSNLNELKFLFTIPSDYGIITSIVFSDNNPDLFAFGTSRGVFKLILLKLSSSQSHNNQLDKQQWQEIYFAKSFTEFSINLIVFQDDDLNEFRLFLADEGCNVYMIIRMKTFSSIIFKNEFPVKILSFDHAIHQLETNKQYLLVSSDDKSSIFNMETISLNKVGTKSRPNGIFGSCFYSKIESSLSENKEIKFIFTARPSLRLWQANQEGQVICTHQFKDYLNKSNCNFIYLFKDTDLNDEQIKLNLNAIKSKPQLTNSNFNQIFKLNIKGFIYLVTFTNVPKTMLFIINPLNAQMVFWTNYLEPIKTLMISDNELIIHHMNESTNSNNGRLFTLIKIYDLNDFLDNVNYILNLSNLSLFCFLNENLNLVQNLINDNLILRNHIDNEWSKLDSEFKLLFSHIKKLIDIQINDNANKPNSNSSSTSLTNSGDNISNDENANGLMNCVISNGNSSEFKLEAVESTDFKVQKTNDLIEKEQVKQNQISNGKISIDELTSKHRWKKQKEQKYSDQANFELEMDEKKVRIDKLNKFKQSSDEINKFKCKCNYPLPRAHLMMNSKQREIKLILIKLLDDENLDEILDNCFEYGIWSLYLDLLILKRQYVEFIKIVVLLMDINLLTKNSMFIQIFKSNLSLSNELFELFVQQKNLDQKSSNESINSKSICLICKTNLDCDYIKWQDIIDFFYKNLNINDLIDLLMIHHQQLPYSVLNSKLCIHLLKIEMIKQYESSLTNDKLTKLNHHLTSRNSKQKSKQNTDDWSMFLDLNERDCDICNKSLKNFRSSLLVFKCNHVYHKDCDEINIKCSKRTCYVCSNYK